MRRLDDERGRVRVRYHDDKSKVWVPLADVALPERGNVPVHELVMRHTDIGTVVPTELPPQPAGRQLAAVTAERLGCGHCNRPGHEARCCSFGLEPDERFLPCAATEPVSCFSRTFIVPLRRAPTDFDPAHPREGRLDVGLRCVSSALFRSQSLRRNTQVTLCLAGSEQPQLLEVLGSMVRELRPDELSLASRLRAVSCKEGAATAQAELERARRDKTPDAVGAWSRSETRGIISSGGDVLEALKRALAVGTSPPILLLLSATGRHSRHHFPLATFDPLGTRLHTRSSI